MRPDDFDGSQVIETETMVLFWQPPGVFGQWTSSRFVVDGVTYGCAEQFMMAEKARLFGDEATRAKILATDSPRQHKALGREVAGFVQAVWERECLEIVVRGNRAKFGQDPDLRAALLATGDKLLVEASPLDRIWGVGLRADDPRIHDTSRWRGKNLLGEALMRVRAELRAAADKT
ncbi:NADAR family protein [Nannocystis pusilla]|uniref:NADAR family protein n=1 Tax=Nannocystis pusilla TaxID=889268 RepID=A0ABS7TNX6_9BACT|nr:NADAR family protein [Nannocystis pusilla]MBZ5709938.1 NADAR family protein [Nannocystis pusilla]